MDSVSGANNVNILDVESRWDITYSIGHIPSSSHLPSSGGIVPVKPLDHNERCLNDLSLPIFGLMCPSKLFQWRTRDSRFVNS